MGYQCQAYGKGMLCLQLGELIRFVNTNYFLGHLPTICASFQDRLQELDGLYLNRMNVALYI